jgi:DNA-binding MarR family transcriptional regulator
MIVSLTEAGFSLIERIFPRHARIAESVFSVLEPGEKEKLGALLEKLGKANM